MKKIYFIFIPALIILASILLIKSCKVENSGVCNVKCDTIPTRCLVAYYPFNGNANDESGNVNNGIVNGPTLTTDRFGNDNKAYSFDGILNYIEVPNSTSLQFQNSFTIAVWVNVKGWWGNEWAPLIAKGDKKGFNMVFAMYGHRTAGWLLDIDTVNVADVIPGQPSLSTNIWTFCVLVWDGNNSYLYMNQNKYTLKNYTGVLNINNENLRFGYGGNPSIDNICFNGIMDDIRIYSCALADSEIQALYHEGGRK